jgi:hypothetical protein
MNKLLLFLTFLLVFCAGVSAQEDSTLKLTEQTVGQTFAVQTGTVIEVRLFFGELYIAYDPTLLRFLDYTPPNLTTEATVETTLVEPEFPAVGDPSNGEAGILPAQLPAEPSLVATAETPVASSGVGTAEIAVVGSAPVGTPANPEDLVSIWRFLAVGKGETTLELRSFYPPCPSDQPCPMMPEFSLPYDLVIEGEPLISKPVAVEGDVILLTPTTDEQTLTLEAGQIIALNTDAIVSPFRLIYQPLHLQILDGEGVRFLVNTAGVNTRLGIQDSQGNLRAFGITIPPLCDSCGVRGG